MPPGSEAVYCKRSTAHCPPVAEAVYCRSSTAHCPPGSIAGGSLPIAPRHCGIAALRCRSCTADCPQTVRRCIAGGPMPNVPRQ